MGGHVMSADIIPFIPRQSRKRGTIGVSVLAAAPDDLVMRPEESDPVFAGDIDA